MSDWDLAQEIQVHLIQMIQTANQFKESELVPVGKDEITVKIAEKNPPSTVNKADMHVTIIRLRGLLKQLGAPYLQHPSIEAAFAELEASITARSSKETRLQRLQTVRQVITTIEQKQSKRLKEAQQLVQSLPTVPNLPVTDTDNIVRAIVAILRSNGAIS